MNEIELDELDIEIIHRLQYNGRLPLTDIAEELGVAEGTIRRRVKQLTESGVMQVVAVVEPEFLGWNAAGMVGITVQSGQVEAVAQAITQFPEVSYLFMVAGEFDLFVEIYCRDMEHFVSFLSETLQRIPGVQHTRTFMILKMYKLSYRWGEAAPPRRNPLPPIASSSSHPGG